jgi:hypothetical protein
MNNKGAAVRDGTMSLLQSACLREARRGVEPEGMREAFAVPIMSLLEDLSDERLPYAVTGLLYGYHIQETILVIKERGPRP